MEFGEKLQMLRKARGWSQEELAQQINVSRQALSKWESGAAVADTENVVASAPAAAAVPAKESKWPVPRIAWLVTLIVSVVGRIALHIWAATLPPTPQYYGPNGEYSGELTGIRNLTHIYDLDWLVLLLCGLLIVGFLGTFFYEKMRTFVKKHFLP